MAIHTEVRGNTFLITIDRPERRNSLDMEHFGRLANAWIRYRDDDDLRCAIITGVEDTFCVGAALKSFVTQVTANIDALASGEEVEDFPADAALTGVLREFELYKPVIAGINGLCAAGGLEMLHSIDIRVCSDKARFSVAEAKRGLFPGGGTTVQLPRHIPYCRAMEMLLTADFIDAEKAYEYGLVNKVVPHDQLLDAAFEYADRIQKNGPVAIRKIKESVLKGLRRPLQEAFNQELNYAAEVFMTEDAQEGPLAFKEKREPVWKNK